MFAHAGVPGFSSGFVGVDVFFVLSGFLITGLLISEYNDHGSIRYATFLARRLRRLLPALLVVLACVMAFSPLMLSSYEARLQTGSLAFAATWTSNFYFALAEFDYFAALKAKDLLLHTWSLGIEEQFYIVWPLLMVATLRYGTRRSGSTLPTDYTAFITAMVFAASFSLCLFWTQTDPLLAFYMMPSRAWQFALGAAVMLIVARNQRRRAGTAYLGPSLINRRPAGLAGLLLIVGSGLFLNREMAWPGYLALLPSVGGALVLLHGAGRQRSVSGRLLTARPLIWLGDRSYSLYLWHWPVLLLYGAYDLAEGFAGTTLVLGTTVVLAALSYQFVERPIWKGRFSATGTRQTIALSILGMVAAVGVSQQVTAALAVRNPAVSLQADNDLFTVGFDCDSWYTNAEVKPCVRDAEEINQKHEGRKTIVLVGDSIGVQWAPMLSELYPSSKWQLIALTKSACAMADVEYYYKPAGGTYDVCTAWREASIDYIEALRPAAVFVGSSSLYDFSASQWVDGMQRTLSRLAGFAPQVVVIPGNPALSFHGPSCIAEPYRFTARLRDSERMCEEAMASEISHEVFEYLTAAASDFDNAYVLNLNDLVCPGNRCAARTPDGQAVYRDSQHLTPGFVVRQTSEALARLNAAGAGPQFLTSENKPRTH